MSFKNWSVYVATLVGVALVSSARGEEPESLWQPYEVDAVAVDSNDDLVEVEETWTIAEDPQENMKASRTAFLKKDAESAANELRHAADIVRQAIDDAVDVPKVLLEESARELERLSRDVAYGTVHSVEALDHAFARAHHALATHYHQVATNSLASNELRRAGHALGASVRAFEHAIEWSGEKLGAGVKLTIDSALLLSGKLIEGTGFVAKEAGELVADLGNEIEKFGIMVDPYSNN